jgi:hypothetical protein
MLLIYAKPQNGYSDATQCDWHLPLSKISINFNNFSGLMNTMTQEQLFHLSASNGLEMDYGAWAGEAYSSSVVAGAGGGGKIPLVGGMLVIKPSKDFALQEGLAPNVLGNFNLQFSVDMKNTSASAVIPSLFVVTVNSGFFETLAGSSRIIKGVLSEADIISAEPILEMSRDGLKRMVGTGFFSSLGSMLSKAVDIYTKTKPAVSALKGALPEGKIKDIMGKVGYGMAGAGMAGAGMAGAGKKSLSARLM